MRIIKCLLFLLYCHTFDLSKKLMLLILPNIHTFMGRGQLHLTIVNSVYLFQSRHSNFSDFLFILFQILLTYKGQLSVGRGVEWDKNEKIHKCRGPTLEDKLIQQQGSELRKLNPLFNMNSTQKKFSKIHVITQQPIYFHPFFV